MDAATDVIAYAQELERAHAARLGNQAAPASLRPLIERSWDRALAAGVDPEGQGSTVFYKDDEVRDVREAHALAPVVDLLRNVLGGLMAADARQVLVIADADGRILWLEGELAVRNLADSISFSEGVDWSEAAVGTNAIGTALALDHAVQVFSGEHLVRSHHVFTCAGAPLHDPETGALLGVVDISGPVSTAHPHNLAVVSAAAGLAEEALRARMEARHERLRQRFGDEISRRGTVALASGHGRVLLARERGWHGTRLAVDRTGGPLLLPDGRPAIAEPAGEDGLLIRTTATATARERRGRRTSAPLALRVLGSDQPTLTIGGTVHRLGERHAEILALLALHPKGMSAEQLALALYGEEGSPVSARAEVSRLRRILVDGLVPRPYRLAGLEADVLEVLGHVDAGRLAEALLAYPGPLLPRSEAPMVVEAREDLDEALRRAVLKDGSAEVLLRWARTPSGLEDPQVHEQLAAALAPGDPRTAQALVRAERLRARYAVS